MNEKHLDLALLEDRILFDVSPLDAQVVEPVVDSFDVDSDMDLFNWADTSQSSDSSFIDSQFADLSAAVSAEQQLDEIESLLVAEIDSDIAINIAAEYKQLIVVDQGVDNYLELIDAAIASNPPEHFEIMLIDSSDSALQRINERLSETSYSAVHLVAHGQDGELSLGNEVWNRDFVATHAAGFSVWSQRLSVDADLMIYGCNVAGTEFGVAFVNELSKATGTDIAASSDLSGATELGGDWDLEHQTGAIEHSEIFDFSTDSYWVGLLDIAAPGGTVVTTGGLNGGTSHDAVAIAADGDFVVTWTQTGAASNAQIYAQMYNADGTAKAAAFVVNDTIAGDREFASVASDANGNFVIVWTDTTTDRVFGKRFANDGSVTQSEFLIDNQAQGATVAMNDSGQFVVAWEETNHTWHVKAQTYDASGAVLQTAFVVNSDDWVDVSDASVDMNSAGDFAVSWTRDESYDNIYVASFDINGGRIYADDIKVADFSLVPTSFSDVSINDLGDVAVSYTGGGIGSTSANVQLVNSDGSYGNLHSLVNDTNSGDQTNTSINLEDNGDFLVVWEGNGLGDKDGIHGKVYNASLDQFTAEVTSNTYTTGVQSNASFAINDAGDFVLVFSGDGPVGSTIFVADSFVPNLPPSGASNTIQTSEDVTTTISISDFGYTDSDGDPLAKIKVLSLPSNGRLLLNGEAVSVDDEILESELSANLLMFEPNTGYVGEVDFQFQVFDAENGAIANNTLTINVHEDIEVTFDEDIDYSFAATDFSTVLTIDHVQIVSLPQNGVLTLSGTAVSTGENISKADIDAGNLVFEPAENQFGAPYDSFEFRIFDGAEYSDETSTVSIWESNFSANASGFVYADDVFGTNEPSVVSGLYDPNAGMGGGGGLIVDLGPHKTGNSVSGGWTQTVNVLQDTIVRISVQHKTQLSDEMDAGEYAEAVLEVNGVRVGDGEGSSLNRINGVDGNGLDEDSGWQTSIIEVQLDAGANTIVLGGGMKQVTTNDEWARVTFDNVSIEELAFSEFEIKVNSVNDSPTDITLDNQSVDENAAGAIIGNLTTFDPDPGATVTYSVDNTDFEVVGGALKLKDGISLNREDTNSVTLQITAKDNDTLQRIEDFIITVNDVNEAPTAITLTKQTVDENSDGGVVGNITVSDEDVGDTHAYLVSDSRFEIVGGQLKLKAGSTLNHELEDAVLLSVEATDLAGDSVDVNLTISINDLNETPYDITLDNLSVDENAVNATIGNLGSTDVDVGDSITYSISDNRFEVVSGSVLRLKSGVSLDYEMEPTVALTVTAADAGGLTSNQGFLVTINDIDEANSAYAFSNSYSVIEDNSVGGNLISDNTGDGTDYGFGALVMTTTPVVLPTNGTVTLLSDGSFSYSPDPDFAGSDSFQYEITDANNAVATATVDISVVAVNDAPNDFTFSNLEITENSVDNSLIGIIVVDDPDVGDTFTYTLLDSSDGRFSIDLAGQLLVADGSRLDFEDVQFHSIDVSIEDSVGEFLLKTFTVQLLNGNDAPEASGDLFSLNEGEAIVVSSSVFSNDTDQDGEGFIGKLLDGPEHGKIAWNTNGTFQYVHDGSETTNDQFVYTVFDPSGASDTATVSIDVTPMNDAPIAVGESTAMVGDGTLRVKISKLLQNDSDAEGTDLTFEILGEPSNGTVEIKNGRVVYTPDPGFIGREQIFYRVSDGVSFSNSVALDISVNLASLNTGTSVSNETEEPAAVEEEGAFTEQFDETDQDSEEVEIAAILESDDDDEVVLQRLGQMAEAQSLENELGLRSDSDTEDAKRYEFTSDLKTSKSFGNDLEFHMRYRLASEQNFKNSSTTTIDYQTAGQFDFSYLSQDLDNFDHSFEIDGSADQVTFATLSSITGALTVGYVLWMVRGGMLMASFVSSIPVWQSVDPLNIVEFGSIDGGDIDEESLESIVTQFSSQA